MALVIGSKYHRLTVLAVFSQKGAVRCRSMARCLCDCGAEITVRSDRVGGNTKSCGCLNRESSSARIVGLNTTHGRSGSTTYTVWSSMKERCLNPKHPRYSDYGGRGLVMDSRWLSFENFLQDMGECPPGLSLDRKDNSKGYELGNCRWATKVDQANNKRSNRVLTFNGKSQTVAEWSRSIGISSNTIRQRLDYYGWSVKDALSKGV